MLIFWTCSISASCVSFPHFGPTLLSIMKHSCVTFSGVQSAGQVKQQHTCADDVWLAVQITGLLGAKRQEREAVHYTAFCAKFKKAFSCISTSHYGLMKSCLVISVKLTQYCVTTEGFKASVIFAFMPHIVGRGVSVLCAKFFSFW